MAVTGSEGDLGQVTPAVSADVDLFWLPVSMKGPALPPATGHRPPTTGLSLWRKRRGAETVTVRVVSRIAGPRFGSSEALLLWSSDDGVALLPRLPHWEIGPMSDGARHVLVGRGPRVPALNQAAPARCKPLETRDRAKGKEACSCTCSCTCSCRELSACRVCILCDAEGFPSFFFLFKCDSLSLPDLNFRDC